MFILKTKKIMTIEPKYVSFNQAKRLKEKGFKELCIAAFHKDNSGKNDESAYFSSGIISQSEYFKFPTMSNGDKIAVLQKDYVHTILRPEQHQVVDWLLEKHGIWVNVSSAMDTKPDFRSLIKDTFSFCYYISPGTEKLFVKNYHKSMLWQKGFKTPQEAYSAAITYCLKEII